MLQCKKIERLKLKFYEKGVAKEKGVKDFSFLTNLSNLQELAASLKYLLVLRSSSEQARKFVSKCLAEHLSLNFCTLEDFGISEDITSVQEIIDFFGEEGSSEISHLKLSNYPHLTDLKPLKMCTKLSSFHIKNCDRVTGIDFSCRKFLSLYINNCKNMTNFTFLSDCIECRSIEIHRSDKITDSDIALLKNCTELKVLKLSNLTRITNLSPLRECPNLARLVLKDWNGDLTSLKDLKLGNLTLSRYREISSDPQQFVNFLKNFPNVKTWTMLNCSWVTKAHIDAAKTQGIDLNVL